MASYPPLTKVLDELEKRPWIRTLQGPIVVESDLDYDRRVIELEDRLLKAQMSRESYDEQRADLEAQMNWTSILLEARNPTVFLRWTQSVSGYLTAYFHRPAEFLHVHFQISLYHSPRPNTFQIKLAYHNLQEQLKVCQAVLIALQEFPI